MPDVLLAESVESAINDLPADRKDRVKENLAGAGERPDRQLKKLSNRDDYSVRIGDYRAIVDWDKAEGTLYVTDLGHRQNVYDQ